jgi:hypothetical protein
MALLAALETPVPLERQENLKPQLLYFSTAFRLVPIFCKDDMPAHELSSFFGLPELPSY